MRVTCILDELISAVGQKEKEFAREVGIDERTLRKLRENRENWRLSKATLDRLMLYAFEKGYPHGIFEIRPHPVWDTFDGKPISIYRGSRAWDSDVEGRLRRFLEHLNHHPKTEIADREEIEGLIGDVHSAMASRNCVFVGSPKANPASEVALSRIWDIEPFQELPNGERALPLQFLGMEVPPEAKSTFLRPSSRHGFLIRTQDRTEPGYLPVTWLPPERYKASAVGGVDGAVVVVARDPCGSGEPVTTIVIAGYTGRATSVAAAQLTHGDPPIHQDDLRRGAPTVAALRFSFRKFRYRGGPKLSGLREEVRGSETWGPPWSNVFKR